MMRLVATAGLLLVAAIAAVQANIHEKEGHTFILDERLGRFRTEPYTELYKLYAASFVLPNHPGRDKEDFRNYMPSGDECMIFFKEFRINQYKLVDLEKFVLLDACLGYLYRNDHQERDLESSKQVQDFLEQLKGDNELQKLWENTKIEEFGIEKGQCFSDLLWNVILAKHQFPSVVCNNHYLQVFLQFAECQSGKISAEEREQDSYLNYIYNLLKEQVGRCVEHEIGHIDFAVREAYARARTERAKNLILSKFSHLKKQSKKRMWPKEMTRLLAAVQGTTDEVNQREVHKLIRGVIKNDERLTDVLLNNLAQYATSEIKPESTNKEGRADPTGVLRYSQLIDSLCNPFRASDRENKYDFATPLIRLVQLLTYEDLFGITTTKFIADVLRKATESAPIYLSVQACNILTFTDGAIKQQAGNGKQSYKVLFKPDTKGMVLWPDAGFY